MYIRLLTAILLSALLTATASSQTKDSSKDAESAKASEPKGPDQIEGKNLKEWLNTATKDLDPAIREGALVAISNFSLADVRKVCGKALIGHLPGERDNGVKIALINFIAELGLEDSTDIKDATRLLASNASGNPSILRMTALQALGKFGSKAYNHISDITTIQSDPSYVIRQALARTLGQIGSNETLGPSVHAIQVLGNLAKDPCAVVRLAALQSLCAIGPPWEANVKPGPDAPQAQIDEKVAQVTIDLMKSRIGKKATTTSETDKQLELWCRLTIIRFNPKAELDEQLNGIAAHLSDPKVAVKIEALKILSFAGENAASKTRDVVKLLDGGGLAESAAALRTKQAVRIAALHTLGTMKAVEPILKVIDNPREDFDVRIAALDALAMAGEKGEAGREILKTIITNDANLKGEGVTLLVHALIALRSMGTKARGSIPELTDLMLRLDKVRDKRLTSPEHIAMLNSPELKLLLGKLDPEEQKKLKEKLFANPEDEFKKGIEEAIKFIKDSTPGHPGPGGEAKKE